MFKAASTPEGENNHKRDQLRELAALNGTLRDDENQVCQNCGGVGHRKYDCPEQRTFNANVVCRICGNNGHMARDCTVRPNPNGPIGAPGAPQQAMVQSKGGFDSEYASLMAELGESAGGGESNKGAWGAHGGTDVTAGGSSIPPWRRPEMWIQPQSNPQGQGQQGYQPQMYGAPGYGGGGGYGAQQYQQAPAGYSAAGGYGGQDYSAAYAQYYQGQYNNQMQGGHGG